MKQFNEYSTLAVYDPFEAVTMHMGPERFTIAYSGLNDPSKIFGLVKYFKAAID